jgi:hypothetical protein
MNEQIGDIWFSQWLVIDGKGLRDILVMALAAIAHQEEYGEQRTRKRREVDQRNLEAMVEVIIANLARAALLKPEAPIVAVSLSKSKLLTRYDRHIFRQLRDVLTKLLNEAFLTLLVPAGRGWSSTMQPSQWFLSKLREHKVSITDVAQHPHEETIWLAKNEWSFGEQSGIFAKRRKIIDYKCDTTDSIKFREEMFAINRHLASANLALAPSFTGIMPDLSKRQLRRSFSLPDSASAENPKFNLGGRLFGGWWLNMLRDDRKHILIDGEPQIELDFASMFPRLAFAAVGLKPPEGDIYDIPELRNHRAAVKSVVSTLLFANGERQRLPSEIKQQLPEGMTIARIREIIVRHHPFMDAILEKGLGLQLMFTESQIMVTTLLDLNSQGITALGIHDSLIVARSKALQAKDAMQRAAKAVMGYVLPVEIKGTLEAIEEEEIYQFNQTSNVIPSGQHLVV